jgi:DNA-binding NarL/FixJ family response regulator
MPIRVVVAEDSFLAREGIVSILDDIEDVELVEMSSDLDELRSAVERTEPDIVLTDIRMPPTNTDEGIRFAAELREKHPDMGVVVLSQHAEPRYAMALFDAGSERRAYLLKERLKDQAELSRALHDVAAGRSLVDSRVVDKLVSARQRDDSVLQKLTPRELEILGLIAEGRSNGWIADSLVITKRAVERHINAIFLKLDLGKPEDVSRRVKAALVYLSGDAPSTASNPA